MPDEEAERPPTSDHKKKAPKKKAVDQVRTVTLDGHDYRIDPDVFDDLEFLELYEDQKWIGMLRHMLGPVQWQQFKENHANEAGKITAAKFTAVMEDFKTSTMAGELEN